MRIGIFGGTFDPPHIGHLALAQAAMKSLQLDEVMFMPAARNPLKRRTQTPSKHRLEMVRRLIENEPNMTVSDLEITRGGASYAVDSLSELQMVRSADYWFLVGSDALQDFMTWKQPERLLRLCRLGVAGRGGRSSEEARMRLPKEFQDKLDIIEMPPMDVSASELRNQLLRGAPTAPLIPECIRHYIESNKLYKNQ